MPLPHATTMCADADVCSCTKISTHTTVDVVPFLIHPNLHVKFTKFQNNRWEKACDDGIRQHYAFARIETLCVSIFPHMFDSFGSRVYRWVGAVKLNRIPDLKHIDTF